MAVRTCGASRWAAGVLVLLALGGCRQKELEEENARLSQRVTDLERARDRLQQENDAMKEQLKRAAAEAEAEKVAGRFAAIGWAPGKKLLATFQTSLGDIRCVLRPEEAPDTVANFVGLAGGTKEWTDPKGEKTTRPLYDGTIFHRVIPGFMIQGGDPEGNGTGGPGYRFADEVGPQTVFDRPGLLAMANSGPDTNGSQFFITEGTPTHLNGKHTIFGDCEDLDVVKKIAGVERDGSKPTTDVVLRHVAVTVR